MAAPAAMVVASSRFVAVEHDLLANKYRGRVRGPDGRIYSTPPCVKELDAAVRVDRCVTAAPSAQQRSAVRQVQARGLQRATAPVQRRRRPPARTASAPRSPGPAALHHTQRQSDCGACSVWFLVACACTRWRVVRPVAAPAGPQSGTISAQTARALPWPQAAVQGAGPGHHQLPPAGDAHAGAGRPDPGRGGDLAQVST